MARFYGDLLINGVGGNAGDIGYTNQLSEYIVFDPNGVPQTFSRSGISLTAVTTPSSITISYTSSRVDLGNLGFNAGYSGLRLYLRVGTTATQGQPYTLSVTESSTTSVSSFSPAVVSPVDLSKYPWGQCAPVFVGSPYGILSAQTYSQVFLEDKPTFLPILTAFSGAGRVSPQDFRPSYWLGNPYKPLLVQPFFPPTLTMISKPSTYSRTSVVTGTTSSGDAVGPWWGEVGSVSLVASTYGECVGAGSTSYSGTIGITLLSAGPSIKTELVDLPSLINGSTISKIPTTLARGGRLVRGIAADGTAQIVLRITGVADGEQIRVKLPPSQSATGDLEGRLRSHTEANEFREIIVTAQKTSPPMAFAIYRAPMDFSDGISNRTDKERVLKIRVERISGDSPVDIPIDIVRPPVVLVHGLGDSNLGWVTFRPLVFRDSTYNLYPFNYKKTNDHSFRENAELLSRYLRDEVIKPEMLSDIAISKADFVAHSMGGNIVRTLPFASSPPAATKNNYGEGYVHKLITIGTPHLGTPFARELLKPENGCIALTVDLFNNFIGLAPAINRAGALGDLSGNGDGSGLSPALQRITGVHVPMAMVAGALAPVQVGLNVFGRASLKVLCPNDPFVDSLTDVTYGLVMRGLHDGVVPVRSALNNQTGYSWGDGASLGAKHSSSLWFLGFTGPNLLDPNSLAAIKVVELLNTPVNSSEFMK